MVFWYWYLFSVALLSLADFITLDIVKTGALAAAAHLPLRFIGLKNPRAETWRWAIVATAGMALLWQESYLPPLSKTVWFILTLPSLEYVLDFLSQNVNWKMFTFSAGLLTLVWMTVRKRPRWLVAPAYTLLAAAWLLSAQENINPAANAIYHAFLELEANRIVQFSAPKKDSEPFDIIVISVCSLSWRDLADTEAYPDFIPFFAKFDYIFTNFNTASTYSAESVLRILKSPCGQVPISNIYLNVPEDCYLMDILQGFGFKKYTLFNHAGTFNDLGDKLQQNGHVNKPLSLEGVPVQYRGFDGSPLYADKAALLKFWKTRLESKAERAILFYDTASLHVGAYNEDVPPPETPESYRRRLRKLIADLNDFFSVIEKSGRKAIVIFVPEHGAALSGSKIQPKDLREIPLPAITLVPVAVKRLGGRPSKSKVQIIGKPTSTMALAWLISDFLRNNPYGKQARRPGAIAADFPRTAFMSETGSASVMRLGNEFIYRQKGRDWMYLPPYTRLQPGNVPSALEFRAARK